MGSTIHLKLGIYAPRISPLDAHSSSWNGQNAIKWYFQGSWRVITMEVLLWEYIPHRARVGTSYWSRFDQ
jgi:hypothetical protein